MLSPFSLIDAMPFRHAAMADCFVELLPCLSAIAIAATPKLFVSSACFRCLRHYAIAAYAAFAAVFAAYFLFIAADYYYIIFGFAAPPMPFSALPPCRC
jgi:hypothetical protein